MSFGATRFSNLMSRSPLSAPASSVMTLPMAAPVAAAAAAAGRPPAAPRGGERAPGREREPGPEPARPRGPGRGAHAERRERLRVGPRPERLVPDHDLAAGVLRTDLPDLAHVLLSVELAAVHGDEIGLFGHLHSFQRAKTSATGVMRTRSGVRPSFLAPMTLSSARTSGGFGASYAIVDGSGERSCFFSPSASFVIDDDRQLLGREVLADRLVHVGAGQLREALPHVRDVVADAVPLRVEGVAELLPLRRGEEVDVLHQVVARRLEVGLGDPLPDRGGRARGGRSSGPSGRSPGRRGGSRPRRAAPGAPRSGRGRTGTCRRGRPRCRRSRRSSCRAARGSAGRGATSTSGARRARRGRPRGRRSRGGSG